MKRLLLLLFLFTAIKGFSQDTKEEFLRKNMAVLDINDNDDFSSFAMLDSVLDRYTVFFTGEMHWTEGNFELKWKMLQYLYHKAGVRVLFIEGPRSYSFLMNHYIDRNDSISFAGINIPSYIQGTKEQIFYQNIYRFNQGKAPGEKIILRGLDREFNVFLSLSAVEILFSPGIPQGLKREYNLLMEEKTRDRADSLLRKIEADTSYITYFSGNYRELTSILRSVACKTCDPAHARKQSPRWSDRESLIYRNFLDMIEDHPGQKFYGQFGNNHVYLQPPSIKRYTPIAQPVAYRLNTFSDSPVKGKVCSIVTEYGNGPREFSKADRKLVKRSSKQPFTLYRINQAGAPFDTVSKYYPYFIKNDYYSREEMEYNKKNDHYSFMERYNYTVIGFSAGYQRWSYEAIEIGYIASVRKMKAYNYFGGMSMFFEFNPRQRMHTYRFTGWGGGDPLYFGLGMAYSSNYRRTALFLRPELGLKKSIFSLVYSYNAKLFNRGLEGMNRHMISARVFLPATKS